MDGTTRGEMKTLANVAQLVERLPCKQGVTGSIPVVGSNLKFMIQSPP